MENNEEAFVTETNFAAGLTSRSHPSQSARVPHRDPQSPNTYGANDRYEETPLLSRNIDAGSGPDSDDSGRSDDSAPAWSGAEDFEGRPWWDRPSVGSDDLDLVIQSTDKRLGLLVAPTFPALHTLLWWHHCPKDKPYAGLNM